MASYSLTWTKDGFHTAVRNRLWDRIKFKADDLISHEVYEKTRAGVSQNDLQGFPVGFLVASPLYQMEELLQAELGRTSHD